MNNIGGEGRKPPIVVLYSATIPLIPNEQAFFLQNYHKISIVKAN